ncbi:MAG TPA: putative Ig domain-containing protein [Chthoniobacteraceae bacterium]|jgi:alpha-galactosidase|nr:putative Ig domain-containing protein [Chthoniobacteraceae bacterium]
MKPAILAGALLLPCALLAQSPIPSPAPAYTTAVADPTPDFTSAIRTPPTPEAPRINGPRIYGERPGRPFLYHLPVTGKRPVTITAQGLPGGLILDAATGNITGCVTQGGEHAVTFTARNAAGMATATIRFVIGPVICLTPPMGWNSWNCFHGNIDDAKIRGAADAMSASGLIDHGWTYINMDDRWEGARDAAGNIQPSPRIPDIKALADYIHGKGLKVGLYSSPGPRTCGGAIGSWEHEDQDAATYGGWGMDYLKYDRCTYTNVEDIVREELYAKLLPPDKAKELETLSREAAALAPTNPNHSRAYLPRTATQLRNEGASSRATLDAVHARMEALHQLARSLAPAQVEQIDLDVEKEPYQTMRASLDKVNRDIVYSLCQYGRANVWEWGAAIGGNLCRITGDISADWKSIEHIGFNPVGLERWAGPGHWNDYDMLEIGNGRLTPDENYTHMTLWCMLSAPLLIGCDMTKMTPFVRSLFTNDEVLAVNQDTLGKQGWRAKRQGAAEVWMKPLADGSTAVAFFNRGDSPAAVSVQWTDLKLAGPLSLRDLWRQKDLGSQAAGYSVQVAPHGAELFRVSKETQTSGR